MQKLQVKGKEKEFSDYVVTNELVARVKKDLDNLRQQHSMVRMQYNQDKERRVIEETEFRRKLVQEAADHKKLLDEKLGNINTTEHAINIERENLTDRLRDLEQQQVAFNKRKEKLDELGLLGEQADNLITQKEWVINQKADLQKWEMRIDERTKGVNIRESELIQNRLEVEKLRSNAEGEMKRADIKTIEVDGKLSAITSARNDAERFKGENTQLLQTLKAEKDAIAEAKKQNEIVLKNIEEVKKEVDPKLEELSTKELSINAKLKENTEKFNKEKALHEENLGILVVLEERKKRLDAQKRELETRRGEITRKQILTETKNG